jgi:GH25 family lysozyme M1 (1,4-beta-N-acetylmuramidase)
MTVPQFVDVSQFQPINIDWVAYRKWASQWDGIARVAIRSSYGNGYSDAHFAAYRQGAIDAKVDIIFFYHYAYPQFNNPVDEAAWQHQAVGTIREQDILVLDIEENVPAANSNWVYLWLSTQESNYNGKLPGLYASSAYIQARLQDARLAKYPLWLANWQFTPDERPPVPSPWTSYEFVQYSDKATIPGITGTVDADIFLGVEQPQEDTPVTIDLSNGAVAQFFTGNNAQWTCKQNGYTLHGEILAFYQSFGGNALCGLTHLGLPTSNEIPIDKYPGVVNQEFERGAVRFDPNHELDNPPGSGRVYLIHTDQDPRFTTLQGEVTTLKALLDASTLGQVASLGKQISDDVALIMKLVEPQ